MGDSVREKLCPFPKVTQPLSMELGLDSQVIRFRGLSISHCEIVPPQGPGPSTEPLNNCWSPKASACAHTHTLTRAHTLTHMHTDLRVDLKGNFPHLLSRDFLFSFLPTCSPFQKCPYPQLSPRSSQGPRCLGERSVWSRRRVLPSERTPSPTALSYSCPV